MAGQEKRIPRVRRGSAPSARSLDALSEISASDVENAAAAFRRDAPRKFRSLLDATADDGLEPPTPQPEDS